ncbi:MAG: aminopeptidase N, partial [Nocardioidaceae bacterium]
MRSLTAHEATTRAASVTVTSYDIELDLTIGPDHFGSKASIVFQSRDRQETFVELAPHAVVSAHLNGERLGPDAWYDGRLRLRSLQDENVLDVAAVMSYSHDGEGLHRAVDPEDGQAYVYAMTFLDAAPRIFPCFDQPDLKAPYQMTVRTPGEWTVVGNGAATQTAPGRWQLTETKPLSTYLVTLVAGPYHSVLREHDGIPLGLHCRQSLAQHLDKDADELFAVTAQCFDEYHGLFGIRYPFGEYHQAFVPEFNAGAMENPGCVTFRDEMVFRAPPTDGQRTQRAITIAHEMAHQWFGDLVTMRWWDDLWLNESFADYMGHRVAHDATGYKDSWLGFALVRKEFGLAADQRRSTHPVAGSRAPDTHTALTNFDGISYAKGAVVLRQLRTLLGDQPFIEGVADYLGRFAYGNATLADLMESWERASGHHLSPWCDAWLRSSGVDTLSVAAGADRQWSVERHNGSGPSVTRTHAVTVASYDRSGSETSVPVVVHRDSVVVPFPAYDGPRLVVPDAGDETWAKVRLSREGQADVAELLPHISEPVTRAVIWGALREALMDAEISPGGYLAVLEHALPHERSDLVLERVLGTRARQGALGYV